MRTPDLKRRPTAMLTAVLIGATSLSACGGNTETSKASGPDTSSLSQKGQDRLDAVKKGLGVSPATEGPKPEPGKKIWFIASAMVESVAVSAQGFQDAAKAVGWQTKVIDGKSQPDVMLSGIEQAVAARADGIVLYTIDCAWVKNGLAAAKRAGIPVVGIESENCDPSLESVPTYVDGDYAEWGHRLGSDMALWMAARAKGSGKIIELRETDLAITRDETEGVQAGIKEECPACEIVPVEFTGPEIGPALQQKVSQALLQNPNAVGMIVPYDDLLIAGISSAVVSSGRNDQLHVVSVGGTTPALDLMRQNRGLDADLAIDTRWEGFAAVDWLNRLLHGQTPTGQSAPTGIGHQLVEAGDLPKTGRVPANVDFEAIYKKSWGVGQ
jgi:ribose transport system substrate-binding protein